MPHGACAMLLIFGENVFWLPAVMPRVFMKLTIAYYAIE